MENLRLLEELFDANMIRMIQLFLANKDKEFYLREVSKETRIPVATTYRLVNRLCKLDVIKQIKVSRFKLYKLNQNNDVKYLESFLKKDTQIMDLFVDSIRDMGGIKTIILHGDEAKDRANVFLIGDNIDAGEIKERIAHIKETNKFTVSALILTKEQYEQMSTMNLYSGKKRLLFER